MREKKRESDQPLPLFHAEFHSMREKQRGFSSALVFSSS
jgi:hypothetical protein